MFGGFIVTFSVIMTLLVISLVLSATIRMPGQREEHNRLAHI